MIKAFRADDRLIHGQVATVWSQVTRATRIMVVDSWTGSNPVDLHVWCEPGDDH